MTSKERVLSTLNFTYTGSCSETAVVIAVGK